MRRRRLSVVGDVAEPFTRRPGELPWRLSQAWRQASIYGWRRSRCNGARSRH